METRLNTASFVEEAIELYDKFQNHAIKQAIESNRSLDVIKYLYEITTCPLECIVYKNDLQHGYSYFGSSEDEEVNEEETWVAALMAVQYGRFDLLRWLDELGYELDLFYNIPYKTNLLEEAIEHRQYTIIEWLITKCNARYAWEDVIKFFTRSHFYLSDGFLFLTIFERYLTQFLQSQDLQIALNLGEYKIKDCLSEKESKAEFNKQYVELLLKALDKTYSENKTDRYLLILHSLEKINDKLAFQAHVDLLIGHGRYAEALQYCTHSIENQTKTYELASITVAELLISNLIELDEKDSPLELLPLEENYLKRGLQGFYLLIHCSSDQAKMLRGKFHDLLSGIKSPTTCNSTAENWLTTALFYYPLYISFKQNPADNVLHAIKSRYKAGTLFSFSSSDNEVVLKEKRKYRQALINDFFSNSNEKKANLTATQIKNSELFRKNY